ncbi:9858_t:CDS:1, partial [Ambispora leptoticha]
YESIDVPLSGCVAKAMNSIKKSYTVKVLVDDKLKQQSVKEVTETFC